MPLKLSVLPKLAVVADDLTGALDSAVAFACRGLSVVAALDVEHLEAALNEGADVIALSTNTREIIAAAAVAVLAGVGKRFETSGRVIFKKVDSRLKGHIAAEVEALFGQSVVLVCPAIPRLGRVVEDGHVTGAGVPVPIPVAPAFGHLPVRFVDARADSDLDLVVSEAFGVLPFVGAAGLTEALARHLVPQAPQTPAQTLPGPVLMVIGSRDAVTLAQVAQVEGIARINAPNGVVPDADVLFDGGLLQLTPGGQDLAPAEAGKWFAAGAVALIRKSRPGTVLACGGETAAAVLRGLGIGCLSVRGEVLPGLPVSVALDGVPGLCVVTKSGGFGGPQTLVDVLGSVGVPR